MKPMVTKSGAACGAEIACDLAQDIDEETFQEIERAFHDNIVVVFRRQNLSNERHIEFSRRFGELEIHIVRKYVLPDFPEILLISNIRDDRGEHIGLADAGFTWHSDTSYRRRPSRCSLLYAKEVPQHEGRPLGDTVFAHGHLVTEIRQDPRNKFANWSVGLRQQDLCHRPLLSDMIRPTSDAICFKNM